MQCKFCGKETDNEYCMETCKDEYDRRDVTSSLSIYRIESYGKHICRICGKEFAGYPKHRNVCSPICNRAFMKVTYDTSMLNTPKYTIFRRDAYECIYCGSKESLTVDHITPVSAGESYDASNLATACRCCNSAKYVSKLPDGILSNILALVSYRNARDDITGIIKLKGRNGRNHYKYEGIPADRIPGKKAKAGTFIPKIDYSVTP